MDSMDWKHSMANFWLPEEISDAGSKVKNIEGDQKIGCNMGCG